MEKISQDDFIDRKPKKDDFYNDMNEHNAEYQMRDHYVIEMERDLGGRKDKNMARITIWKPQEYNGQYVPDVTDDSNTYYWVGVARRFIEYDKDVPKNLAESDYHFQETLDLYEYDGPRTELDFEVVEN